jgi:hypothetical protein
VICCQHVAFTEDNVTDGLHVYAAGMRNRSTGSQLHQHLHEETDDMMGEQHLGAYLWCIVGCTMFISELGREDVIPPDGLPTDGLRW